MVQKLKRLFGKADIRILIIVSLLTVFVTLGWSVAQISDETNTVESWAELINQYLDFRDSSYPMAVPSWYMYADQIESIENAYGLGGFQNQSDWYVDFSAGEIYFSAKSEIAKQIFHGTQLVVFEDMITGELLVMRDTGEDFEEEIVFKAPEWPDLKKGEPSKNYLFRELSKRRVVWHVTLKDVDLAEEEYQAQLAAIEEDEGDGGGGMMMMLMGGGDELAIAEMKKVTNGLLLNIEYTVSFSGTVWSAYSYDTPACVDTNFGGGGGGDPPPPGTNECTNCVNNCAANLTNSFMGLDRVWTLVYTNLLLTGGTFTAWTDTRPMGFDAQTNHVNRFYAFGNNEIDTDEDGLNDAYELFAVKSDPELWDTDGDELSDSEELTDGTNPLNPDSDSDGLSDGWETANGLDPNDATGASGASGDPDGDSLSNLLEQNLGTSPWGANVVVALAPSDVSQECRAISTERHKFGYSEFTNASSPAKYYIRADGHFNFDSTSPNQNVARQVVDTFYSDIEPCVGSYLGITSHAATLIDASGGGISCGTYNYTITNSTALTPLATTDTNIIVTQTSYQWSYDEIVSTNDALNCGGWYEGEAHNIADYEMTLSLEYSTAVLEGCAIDDFSICGDISTVAWGSERSVDMGQCSTGGYSSCSAMRDLASNEYSIAMSQLEYRYLFTSTQGVVYCLTWLHWFTPENSTTGQIYDAGTAYSLGAGGQQYFESDDFTVDPPTSDGTITPGVLMVESETMAPVPPDRSRKKLGVGEVVTLTLEPSGLSPVTWNLSGDGTLSSSTGNPITFTAHDRASTPTITATHGGASCAVSFNVVEPTEVVMEQIPGTGIWHVQGEPSCGFMTWTYVKPDDVSFENIEVREGYVDAVCTGYFDYQCVSGWPHPNGSWLSMGYAVPGMGSIVNAEDTVQGVSDNHTPYEDGSFTWAIPYYFRVGSAAEKQFTTVNQVKTVDSVGTMTMSKAGVVRSADLNDPDSDYYGP